MAKPFGQSENSEKQQTTESKNSENKTNFPSTDQVETENASECSGAAESIDQIDGYAHKEKCLSNSKLKQLIHPSTSMLKDETRILSSHLSNDPISKERFECDGKIEVKRGVLTSNRKITFEDVQIVSTYIKDDWKELLKKLPGVTSNNLHFHQAFIDAMDRGNSTNMAEIALSTWKDVLPEFSTIGNLSRALFNIGHPDVVTCLRP